MSVYQQLYDYAFQLTQNDVQAHRIVWDTIEVGGKLKPNIKREKDMMACLMVTCRNKSYDWLLYENKKGKQ